MSNIKEKIMRVKNIFTETVVAKITKGVKSIGNWILIIITALSAFFLGYYYPKVKQTVLGEIKMIQPKTADQISTSITDRGELLIMDRATGKFEVYDEAIGLNVFKAYGSRITQTPGK